MCSKGDGIEPSEGAPQSDRDETTINALNILFKCNLDRSRALQQLGKDPMPLPMSSKWPEDEVKLFIKGLKSVGKNFFRIKAGARLQAGCNARTRGAENPTYRPSDRPPSHVLRH